MMFGDDTSISCKAKFLIEKTSGRNVAMTMQRHVVNFTKLSSKTLNKWHAIPPAIVSDCMNRTHFMTSAIKPLKQGLSLIGQARTVTGMVGDNGISHAAIALAEKGEVLVIDAGGYEDVAIWGGIMTHAAMARGIAGVVIDGANRDTAEIQSLGFPLFSRSQVPSGPHKDFGGIIDGSISCGGCPVRSGDLVLGDDDGIAVVPLEWTRKMLVACEEKLRQEKEI
jgi:regulator of RNase E activity RraA